MIYADHAATTALSPAALEAMQLYLFDEYANPSTMYRAARKPKNAVLSSRRVIAEIIGAEPSEVYFTSGGTEADNWALKGLVFSRAFQKKRIITSAIEHHAILHTCDALARLGCEIVVLPVDKHGLVSAADLSCSLTSDTLLVSIMMANNEVGTIEPIKELATIAHNHGVLFHTDAVQAIGHMPINVHDLGVDMLSASAHKFNGPKGVGFLYVRNGVSIQPLIDGGGQENGMRAGTENVAGIVGMSAALAEHVKSINNDAAYLEMLRERLLTSLRSAGVDFLINGASNHVPGSMSLSFKNVEGEMLMHRLDIQGISVATGSACNSKETVLSHVIKAIGVPEEYAAGTIRITLGMDNDEAQIDHIAACIRKIIHFK